MINRLGLLAAALAASTASATPPIMTPPAPAAPPPLTLVIAVDGLSAETFDRYRGQFSGGLARIARGARFESAAASDSLLGGPRSLAAVLKQGRPGSKVLVVAGSSSVAAAVVDPAADQSWVFSGNRFALQNSGKPPAIATQANAAVAAAIATAEPPLEVPPTCAAPPLATRGARFARAAGDAAAYQASPQMDGGTLAFTLALARDLGLGSTTTRADVLAIGLSATASVAAAYGPASQEMCLNLVSLDRDLGDALAYLDRSGTDYAVVLAGTSTGTSPLLWWRKDSLAPATGGPARRMDVTPTIAAMAGAPIPATSDGGACLTGMPGIICPPKR